MAGPYLVLANSRKLGGRCVAVVDRSGGWVRPVSGSEHGELTNAECTLGDQSRTLAVLDVVGADFGAPSPTPYQPEDHAAPPSWRLWDPHPSAAQVSAWLDATVDHSADFLARGRQDRIRASDITPSSPLRSSLALVRPSDPSWRTMSGSQQIRVSFSLDGVTNDRGYPIDFDLVVTDPQWEHRVRRAAGGAIRQMTPADLGIANDRSIYLTVSLGEPFQGDHYKLVAAVIL